MKKLTIYVAMSFIISLLSAAATSQEIIPTSETLPSIENNYTIIWLGNSKAYRYTDGKYKRDPSYDYTFDVVQRRYGNTWKSIKEMHRINPDYDGKAGDRNQTMYFEIEYKKSGDDILSEITSSLGNGKGKTDNEFREQTFVLIIESKSRVPYNRIKITQHYNYEEGILLETVELFKLKDGKEIPFMKNEEKAIIFRPTILDNAPTKFE